MDALLVGLALVVGGAVLVWVSWAGSQGSLRPNGIVGLRVPSARRSDAAWYAAHRAAAGPWASAAACSWPRASECCSPGST